MSELIAVIGGTGKTGPVTHDNPIPVTVKDLSLATEAYVWDTNTLAWVKSTGGTGPGTNVAITNLPAVQTVVQTMQGAALAPATASVNGASNQVVAANAGRKGLVVINVGSSSVFFGCGYPAALNSGITLTANGVWVMDAYTFTAAAIYAICSGTSTLSIQEYQ